MKRNLVIVRAGDTSLHTSWGHTPDCSWDLIVSYFGNDAGRFRGPGITRIDDYGPKWPILSKVLSAIDISNYAYVFFPDDDLALKQGSLDIFFGLCETYGLDLAQPSLSTDSYIAHELTIHNPNTILRFTNFVEIMAPCFSAAGLAICSESFASNLSGWGLDALWPILLGDDARVGIIDSVQMRHTRPFWGPNYRHLAEAGVTPKDELYTLFSARGISRPCLRVSSGINVMGNFHTAAELEQKGELWPLCPWLI